MDRRQLHNAYIPSSLESDHGKRRNQERIPGRKVHSMDGLRFQNISEDKVVSRKDWEWWKKNS